VLIDGDRERILIQAQGCDSERGQAGAAAGGDQQLPRGNGAAVEGDGGSLAVMADLALSQADSDWRLTGTARESRSAAVRAGSGHVGPCARK
jgi:hypothetical protein